MCEAPTASMLGCFWNTVLFKNRNARAESREKKTRQSPNANATKNPFLFDFDISVLRSPTTFYPTPMKPTELELDDEPDNPVAELPMHVSSSTSDR